jgi:hypothetical protein
MMRGMSESGPDQAQDAHPGQTCIWCGGEMQSVGVEEFRVGGTSGGWKLVFGEWAELGEGMLKLEVFACPACRRVEMRVPPGG